jgi:tetratricopeptide (TPR) repeat protein
MAEMEREKMTPDEAAQYAALMTPAAEAAPATELPGTPPPPEERGPRRRPLLIVLAVAALALPALGMTLWIERRQSTERRAMIAELRASVRQLSQEIESVRPPADVARPPSALAGDYYGLLAAGNLDLRNGRLSAAMAAFRAAIKADTQGHLADEAHFRLAECHARQGQADQAIEEYRLVISSYPGSPLYTKALAESAQLLIEKKEHAQARRLLYQLLACRDRLPADEVANLAQAHYRIAETYDAEATLAESHTAPSGSALGLTARAEKRP